MNWLNKANGFLQDSNHKAGPSMFCTIRGGARQSIDLRNLYWNAACFVVASGPSLKDVDLDVVRKPGILTIGLNNSPKMFRPDLWVCVDEPARFLESVWRDPKIMKFCGTGKFRKPIWDHDKWEYSSTLVEECPNIIHVERNSEFNAERYLYEDTVNWGNSKQHGGGRSCFVAAIKIMYVLGIRRVYLLGVDFRMTPNYRYSFEEQRTGNAVKNNQSSYLRILSYFTQLAPYFKKANYQVINCTKGSDLTILPYMDIEEAVARELQEIPNPETEKTYGMYVPNR